MSPQPRRLTTIRGFHIGRLGKMTPVQKFISAYRIANLVPTCCWCWRRLTLENATVEHLVPKHKGGADALDNLDLSCRMCNHVRGGEDGPPNYASYIKNGKKKSKAGRELAILRAEARQWIASVATRLQKKEDSK